MQVDTKKITRLFRDVELALVSVNNCVTTDRVDAKPDEYSWKIDNTSYIHYLEEIKKEFEKLVNHIQGNDTFQICTHKKICPSKKRIKSC